MNVSPVFPHDFFPFSQMIYSLQGDLKGMRVVATATTEASGVWFDSLVVFSTKIKLTKNNSHNSFLGNMVYSRLQPPTALMWPTGIHGKSQSFLLYPGFIFICVEDNSFWLLDKLRILYAGILLIQLLSLPCREIFFWIIMMTFPIPSELFFPVLQLDSKSFSVLILVLLEGSSLLSGGQLILQCSISLQTSRDIMVIIGSFWQSSH